MARKTWTPQTEINESLLQFREKRKWQIALRRYVLEGNKSTFYAPYFGLDNKKFRQWIELQFGDDLRWDNFSTRWQFDHIVPVAYFDFKDDLDLRLCWNFINIRVERSDPDKNKESRVDVLAAKAYFENLFEATSFDMCKAMVNKITRIERSVEGDTTPIEGFIKSNLNYLTAVKDFDANDFERLNTGTEIKTLIYEKEFLKKLGS